MTSSFARVGLVLAAAGALAGPASLSAQGMISVPKAAAQRAVAATNAHTDAMQSPTTQAPAAPRQVAAAPTTQGAKPGAAPATKPTAVPAAPLATPVATPGRTPVHTAPIATTPGAATAATTHAPAPAVATRGKPGAGKAAAVASGPAADSAARSISVTERGVKGEVSLSREVFSYDPGGRRDPFVSLLRTGDLRPMLSDLRLVVVLYDPTGRNSIAIMRDVSTKDQYRVKVGQTVGRMRVAQIQPKEIVFTIEEVGFSRQEPLALGDSSTARTQ
jgi:hypothetical protein